MFIRGSVSVGDLLYVLVCALLVSKELSLMHAENVFQNKGEFTI